MYNERKPAREAAWGDLEEGDLLPPSRGSFSSLVRDWACVVQDRERVGALYASPVFHAFGWGSRSRVKGDDARATLYLCYGLLAAFLSYSWVLWEEVAFLKRVRTARRRVRGVGRVSRILVHPCWSWPRL